MDRKEETHQEEEGPLRRKTHSYTTHARRNYFVVLFYPSSHNKKNKKEKSVGATEDIRPPPIVRSGWSSPARTWNSADPVADDYSLWSVGFHLVPGGLALYSATPCVLTVHWQASSRFTISWLFILFFEHSAYTVTKNFFLFFADRQIIWLGSSGISIDDFVLSIGGADTRPRILIQLSAIRLALLCKPKETMTTGTSWQTSGSILLPLFFIIYF